MASSPPAPLTPFQQQEVADARLRAKRIDNAAGLAAFNGWTTGLAAALSLAASLSFGMGVVATVIVCAGLGTVAFNEFRGRGRLLRFDPRGPWQLGLNQLGFMVFLVGYCLWRIYAVWQDPSAPLELLRDPQIKARFSPEDLLLIRDLYMPIVMVVYSTLILVSLLFQGLNAIYYFTRAKYVREHLQETPAWILDKQRAGLMR